MNKINKFIRLLCDDLYIKVPKVEYAAKFQSKTQLAAYIPEKKLLQVKKRYENILDLFFAISHELRHKYQIDHDIYSFENYKTVGQLNNLDYNLQPQEIDANAYAYLIMISTMGVEPKFNGLNSVVVSKIKLRAKEIANEERL